MQASFNRLIALPEGLGSLPRLELVRVACCNVQRLPRALADAPALAWLSLGGNPVCAPPPPPRCAFVGVHTYTYLSAVISCREFNIKSEMPCACIFFQLNLNFFCGNILAWCMCRSQSLISSNMKRLHQHHRILMVEHL